MKTLSLSVVALFSVFVLRAQEFTRSLASFDKIVVSPKINVVLTPGDKESVRIVYAHVDKEKIHASVSGNTLQLYLEGARFLDKRERYSIDDDDYHYRGKVSVYRNASVTAYITYKELRKLQVRGEEEITCTGPIVGDEFVLKAYGESEITLDSIHVEEFRMALYGENKVRVKSGTAKQQTYRLYGENKIDNSALKSEDITTSIYGEGRLKLFATNQVYITAFGEPMIEVLGSPDIRRGLLIGKANITRGK
ncbi:MAG: head GIN domain-containing protein [Flammeovirgaceae bacterium]